MGVMNYEEKQRTKRFGFNDINNCNSNINDSVNDSFARFIF